MASYFARAGAWLRRLFEYFGQVPDPMLAVFFTQLTAEFRTILLDAAAAGTNAPLIRRINAALNSSDERTWTRAYEIQLLLVQLKPRARLEYDVESNIAKVVKLGLPGAESYSERLAQIKKAGQPAQQPQAAPDETTTRLRALLATVLEDLQWFYQTRIVIRKESARGILRIFALGLIVTWAVAFPFLCFLFERWTGLKWFSMLLPGFPNFGLYTAMSFGLLGAYFSLLLSARQGGESRSIEDARNQHGARILFVRAAVGVFGAIVLYFLLASGILASIFGDGIMLAVFPNFENLHYVPKGFVTVLSESGKATTVLIPSKDWCLLVAWSFVAGFSEKLVPDTLARVEDGFTGRKSAAAT